MANLTESTIETFAIDLLKKQGYQYIYGPDIDHDILLTEQTKNAIARINPNIPADAQEDAIKQIQRLNSPDLIANNEAFHRMLTEGININYQKDGNNRGDLVWLIDFNKPENNDFAVLNQYTVIENNINKRLDVVLFINGLPIAAMELKNPADENTTIRSAFKQMQTYIQTIPSIFAYNSFLIISDGLEAKAGTISSDYSRFMAWKNIDGKAELETLIKGMLNKKTILDLIRHFILFEKSKTQNIKKLAAYHQYYAVNKAVKSTLRAAADNFIAHSPPANYGLPDVETQPAGDKKGGVIWHTQGSGKSLSMVFYAGKIILALDNPTIIVLTDRNDLDDQLFDTFAASKQLLRQEPVQAETREQLKDLLKVASGGVVFTTIQKFQPEEGNVYEKLSARKNIIVIADEAHRTQYGFKAKITDDKNENGKVIGQKVGYGFAKYMRDALPNATYIGFTGTPVENTDTNTPKVFGNYIDVYDIAQAVRDGVTVPIHYESRLAKIKLSDEGRKLIKDFDEELEQTKWTRLEAIIGSTDRIKQIAKDIITHFELREEAIDGKGMIVAMSRRIAAELYKAIIELRPKWHNDDLKKGVIKVVMTSASSDGPEIAKHHTTKEQRRFLANRIKNPKDELKLNSHAARKSNGCKR